MKNIISNFIILITLISSFTIGLTDVKVISAQSPTSLLTPIKKPIATPTPTQSVQDTQIEKIKDLVASRVAELKLVDKRGIVGRVKSSTNSQINLLDNKNQERLIDIDELTKFESTNATFGISDIKVGDTLSIIGLYNKQTERLLARFVSRATNIPQNIESVVVSKDAKEFTLTIAVNGKKEIVNIETSTKSSIYTDGEILKSGFSKISTGERIIVVGFPDKSSEDQLNASRIIHFPSLALSEELAKAMDSITPTP